MIGAQRPRVSVLPPSAASTSAGEAATRLALSCGIDLADWQRWCLGNMLAEDEDGRWAAPQSVLVMPRQNGKSELFVVVMLAGLYLFGERKIVYSAHLAKTSTDLMQRAMAAVRANPELDAMTHFYVGNGKESIRRRDTGAVIEFVTRGKRTARGGSPQRVIFDEALFLTDIQQQALLPALSAQSMNTEGAPQLMYGSSAPLPESEVLHRIRNAANDGAWSGGFYAEWSAPPGADIRDRANWYAANPMLGVLISEEWVANQELPPALSEDAFALERLGIVASANRPAAIPPEAWQACRDKSSTRTDPIAFAVAVSPDRSVATVGVADRVGHLEVVEARLGVDWVVERVAGLCEKWRPVGVGVAAGYEAGVLVPALERAGVPVVEVSSRNYQRACGELFDAVMAGSVRHVGQDNLDASVAGAAKRAVGDGLWLWDRRGSSSDLTPLESVTVARWVSLTVEPVAAAPSGGFAFFDLEDDD